MSKRAAETVLAMLVCMASNSGFADIEFGDSRPDLAYLRGEATQNKGAFLNLPSLAIRQLRENILSR